MFAASLEDPRCESGSERLGRSEDSPWNVADRASLIALPPFHPYRTWNHPIPLGLPPTQEVPGQLSPSNGSRPGSRLPCSRIPGLLRWTLSGVESSCASMTKIGSGRGLPSVEASLDRTASDRGPLPFLCILARVRDDRDVALPGLRVVPSRIGRSSGGSALPPAGDPLLPARNGHGKASTRRGSYFVRPTLICRRHPLQVTSQWATRPAVRPASTHARAGPRR